MSPVTEIKKWILCNLFIQPKSWILRWADWRTQTVIFRKNMFRNVKIFDILQRHKVSNRFYLLQTDHVRPAWEPIRRSVPTTTARGPVRTGRIRRLRIRLLRWLYGYELVRAAWSRRAFPVHRYSSRLLTAKVNVFYVGLVGNERHLTWVLQ